MRNTGSMNDWSTVEEKCSQGGVMLSLGCSKEEQQKPSTAGKALCSGDIANARFTPEAERVMVEHLPIVRYIARRIHERLPQHVEIEELVSAGVLGLMDAFQKFDPAKKVQFRSYAQFRIRGAILDSLRT